MCRLSRLSRLNNEFSLLRAGKYPLKSSLGLQSNSLKSTGPIFGFGTCDRDRAALVSLCLLFFISRH